MFRFCKRSYFVFFFLAAGVWCAMTFSSGCAQIGYPTGGIKDTLPPQLIKASPQPNSVNVTGTRISFEFDEYIDVQEIANNLLISPLPSRIPTVIPEAKGIVLKFRDTLLLNTTYNVNFGNAIRDINENNILRNFSYVFSTGATIDSLQVSGNVIPAEADVADSTLIVLLYRSPDDSAVLKKKPDYITRVDAKGDFLFKNLSPGSFQIFALKDKDGSKTYNSKSEAFAFTEERVSSALQPKPVQLFAFTELSEEKPAGPQPFSKRLTYSLSNAGKQELDRPLQITFSNKLYEFDTLGIALTDTNFAKIAGTKISTDSSGKSVIANAKWQAEMQYRLLISKSAFKDSAGNTLAKNDTLKIVTKSKEDYGRLLLRFSGLDIKLSPVLEFLQNGRVVLSYPLLAAEWRSNLFPPGEYGIRILYDKDKNGSWTSGNYLLKKQPETLVILPQKISVRADWDNEREISL